MVERAKRGNLDWLQEKYGVDPDSLDEGTRGFAEEQGPKNIGELVNSARGTRPYRNRRITDEERERLLWQVGRLAEGGGGFWVQDQMPIGRDTPNT